MPRSNRTTHGPSILRALAVALLCTAAGHQTPAAVPQKRPARQSQKPAPQADPADLVARGVAALERGDTASAKTAFESAVRLDKENYEAHTYLGVMADREGNLTDAERHFAAAAIGAPLSPQARNNHGAILLRLGRTEQAAAQFEISLRLDKNQPSPLFNLARIRFSQGTTEGFRAARDLLERAHSLAPDAEIARALVAASLRLGDRDAAARHFKDYAARLAGAPESVTGPAARAELGAALLEANLAEEATGELAAASQAEPANVETLLLLARAHLARKDVKQAGRTLESAVARGLQDGRIYAALADVYEAAGYVENAIPAMRLAIERDPKNEAFRVRYGLLLVDTKAPAAAVIRLEEALRELPTSPRLWLALGIAQLAAGKNDDAQSSFARTLELDPRSVPALAYLGTAHAERGSYAEAVRLYERAIAADPKLSVPYYLAADALLKASDTDAARAEKYLGRAVELDPDFAPSRLALARLYERAGRWAEAAEHLERAVRLDPELAEARYHLGRVYRQLKRADDSKRELAAFQRLSETQKEKREVDRRELVRRLANVRF
ncbi:MAG TPA: tetratricopeptide repeat protein [Pyrinomonadaceae bacterium]|jgi:Tfp pilus assembly protein PilF|nr:tetratricopeptide repeat protein [Pyrinomonadaceae bacterium]